MGPKSNQKEVSHYVVTAHAPGGVLMTCKCNFLSPTSEDVLVAKSRRLEVRQLRSTLQSEQGQQASNTSSNVAETSVSSPFPVVYSVPIYGRLTSLLPLRIPASLTSYVFMTTARFRYAIVSASGTSGPYPFQTHASGSLRGEDYNILGRHAECAPLVAIDPYSRCVALHLYDGLLTILPIDHTYDPSKVANQQSSARKPSHYDKRAVYWPNNNSSRGAGPQLVKEPFHARIEERNVLAISFLHGSPESMPQICILHQDSRGTQIIITHAVDLKKRQLLLYGSYSAASSIDLLKRSGVDGGSSILIPLPSRSSPVAAAAAAAPAASAAPDEAGFQNRKKRDSHGGVIILGQRQITYTSLTTTKVLAVPPSLMLSWEELPPDPSGMPRFLLGDEFGNLHMLMLRTHNERGVALQMDTLGSCTLSSSLVYLGEGLVYVGSIMGDSQLVQVHEEPITTGGTNASTTSLPMPTDDLSATAVPPDVMEDLDTTYLSVVEEYIHLGPIVDFDLVPTAPGLGDANAPSGNQVSNGQSQVVTASGTSRSGTIRLIRNGIGMNEYASVEMSGIQNMWSVRAHYSDLEDAYLVQSFVGQTRVLGVCKATTEDVAMDGTEEDEEVGGTLAEVVLGGLDSNASTLYVGNVQAGDRLLQITESEIRLVQLGDDPTLDALAVWRPQGQINQSVTVATANEAGQIVIALRGGLIIYLSVENDEFKLIQEKQMDREVSCLDVHPFSDLQSNFMSKSDAMDLDGELTAPKSSLVAVGLWDDFTVRLLSLGCGLEEAAQIHLSVDEDEEGMDDHDGNNTTRRNRNNMMARSLCLLTLDFSSSVSSHTGNSSTALLGYPGVDMLFVGLGDGTLVSFAIVSGGQKDITVHSKKEVCLGTQRINLIPLKTESGGTCVLATGDRPTVIYLAGVGGGQHNVGNPKLCYSNVNLQVNDEDQAVDVSRPASQQSIAVNVAAPFYSSLLFETASLGTQYYSLCVADDKNLRLGVIDDIQKLHVTTCRLGMSPRRVAHCSEGRMFAVGCIESGIKQFGLGMETHNLGNCIRFLDDTNFDDIERIDLEPFEMILSMVYASVRISSTSAAGEESSTVGDSNDHTNARPSDVYKPFLFVGTGYALPDEDEPTRGRILVFSCGDPDDETTGSAHRAVRKITELVVSGGVFSIAQFYEGKILASVNSKTHICQMTDEGSVGGLRLSFVGMGHHGHILSLFVRSCAGHVNATTQLAQQQLEAASASQQQNSSSVSMSVGGKKKKPPKQEKDMLAIVGDLMRSISVVQYYPQHETLEEVSRDFNTNWTTAVEMLTDDVYLGGENWNNLFVLRRNAKAKSEELRCRLDTIGEFHLGEMCNKFMRGSLVMPQSSNASASSNRRAPSRRSTSSPKKRDGTPNKAQAAFRKPTITIGSQTLFGTVEGTLGSILGLDAATAAFFSTLERAINRIIRPVGDFTHQHFRAFEAERRIHPCHGFIDGDLIESFLDLDRATMDAIVHEMNRDGGWEIDRSSVSGSGPGRSESGNNGTSNSDESEEFVGHPELSVDDVVAMVEEMSMLH